jgi:hypothetical protein
MKKLDLDLFTGFIKKYSNLVDWTYLCTHYQLPESLITKYKDWVDWYCVSFYQKLTPEFVLKHLNDITGEIFGNPCYKKFPDSLKLLLRQKFNV